MDDDGKGYMVYNSIPDNHGMVIELLNDDYMSGTGQLTSFLDYNVEASTIMHCGEYVAVFVKKVVVLKYLHQMIH